MRKSRRLQRYRRHSRIRKQVYGTLERPRLAVFRSLRNIEGQVINDDAHHTLVGRNGGNRARDSWPGAEDPGARAHERAEH
ncbi:MAG: 50S ribosomal protein L18, partial [Gemmatimonadetes bacterium]|nr:50S ribosomal protein L18 [Gemmatimonadota bacterium]